MFFKKEYAEIFLSRIEKFLPKTTDPDLMKDILFELKFDKMASKDEVFMKFIDTLKNKKMDVSQLVEHVKKSLLKNKPLSQLFSCIQENNLIKDIEIQCSIKSLSLQLHLLFLFESFIVYMINSPQFLEDMYAHIIAQRGSIFPGNPLANFIFGTPLNTSLFKRLKMISVDPAIGSIVFHKTTGECVETEENRQAFINKYQLSGINTGLSLANFKPRRSNITKSGMNINILEAAWQDLQGNNIDNAIAAMGLIGMLENKDISVCFTLVNSILPEGTQQPLIPDLEINNSLKKRKISPIDDTWKNFYIAWNLLFVIKNLDTIFLPLKLLIPSVLSAHHCDFIDLRLLTLFVMGNLFNNLQIDKNPFFSSDYQFKNSEKIFSEWAKINKEYAHKKFQECNDEKISPETLLKDTFGDFTTANLIKNLCTFAYDQENYRITKSKDAFFKPNSVSGMHTSDPLLDGIQNQFDSVNL